MAIVPDWRRNWGESSGPPGPRCPMAFRVAALRVFYLFAELARRQSPSTQSTSALPGSSAATHAHNAKSHEASLPHRHSSSSNALAPAAAVANGATVAVSSACGFCTTMSINSLSGAIITSFFVVRTRRKVKSFCDGHMDKSTNAVARAK